MRIKYIHVKSLSKGVLEEFQRKLDSMSSELGLKYKRILIQNNEERIIVSNTDIPTEDFDLINNEKKESNYEENDVLQVIYNGVVLTESIHYTLNKSNASFIISAIL